jgi:leader peptidase (prepilin peptidase)/N-methyltransferase
MFVALAALFGLAVGSFLNVCIARLPVGVSVVSPGSRCPSCQSPILWYDNIPVISYVLLGGRCRHCRARIGIQYPFVEATTALLFAVAVRRIQPDLFGVGKELLFTSLLIVLFFTDYTWRRLPNVVTLPGLAVGFVLAFWTPPGPLGAVLGAAFGGSVLWFVRWGWKAATGVEGMGLGDVKMLAMVGAFLGLPLTFLVLFLAAISGAILGVALVAFGGRSVKMQLPFGCFLAVAAWIAITVGSDLITWYTGLYS